MSRSDQVRSCGVLLHPTSLPGPAGAGDLGAEAYKFVDFLALAGQGIWQILPLGPVGAANSPYDSSSAFAGNPLILSEEWLVQYGLLRASDIPPDVESTDRANFDVVRERKIPLLREAFARFQAEGDATLVRRFEAFRARESSWLSDFALFRSLHDVFDGLPWAEWEENLVRRDPVTLRAKSAELESEIRCHEFVQYVFDEQWHALRRYAANRGVRLMGDIPIYVSFDSADVWAHQQLFELDKSGKPIVAAGVPPDYFSETGQLWGNPCYNWPRIESTGYRWWMQRFRRSFELHDLVRVDHFRAFQAGWQVPTDEETAINGRWVDGPGADLFECLRRELGSLPIVVEDLGIITDDVAALRERLGLPGMKVLQFAFGDDSRNPYLPHNYEPNCVVYTGTHDNDTTFGWFSQLDEQARSRVERYLGHTHESINWSMIRLAYRSVAQMAMVPAQDLLGLGAEHRMNIPGTTTGDWEWRLQPDALTEDIAARLRDLADTYGRLAVPFSPH